MRRLPPDPLSMRAVWARRLAWFSAAVSGMGALALRYQVLPFQQGMVVLGAGALIALLALLFAAMALRQIWMIGARGLSQALSGFFLSLALLAGPAVLAVQAARTPPLHDVSTDLADPPDFSRSRAALALRRGVMPPPSDAAQRALQKAQYPDIQPVMLDMPPDEALPVLDSTVEELGWQVVERLPPSIRGAPGRIDATQSSLILHLPDDITMRLTPLINRTRIDIRSVSRYGTPDFGSNARRVRDFLAELQAQAKAQ